MMKKVLLTALTGFFAYAAVAQCTPDPNYTPTSAIGAGISDLPCATIGQAYNESATIVIPANLEYSGQNIAICKVTVDSINNIPAVTGLNTPIWYNNGTTNQSYGFGQQITLVPPHYRACVEVQGTFTQAFNDSLRAFGRIDAKVVSAGGTCASAGLPINNIAFTAFAPNGIAIAFKVASQCTAGIEETISNNSFDVAQNFPNPFSGQTQVAINLPASGKYTFRVMNLVGKTVKEVTMSGNSGLNYITVSSDDYAAGVYTYSVTFSGKTVTKRMIIK